jgi:hypothetical protein
VASRRHVLVERGTAKTFTDGGGRKVGKPQPGDTSASDIGDIVPVEWSSFNGGRKQQKLRLHRDEILNFFNEYGPAATMVRYGLMADTLDRLVSRSGNPPARQHLHDLERVSLLAELARAESRSTRLEVESLKREYKEFTSLVAQQVGSAILAPLKQTLDKALGAGDGDS